MKNGEKKLIFTLIMAMSFFQLYVCAMGWPTMVQTVGTHVAFVLALGFLLHPTGPHSKKYLVLDWLLSSLGFFASFYTILVELRGKYN